MDSKLDFRGEMKVSQAKLKRASDKHFARSIKLVCEVRRTDKSSFISISWRCYFEASAPNCFKVFCRILRGSQNLSLEQFLDRQNGYKKSAAAKTKNKLTNQNGIVSRTRSLTDSLDFLLESLVSVLGPVSRESW